MNRLNSKINSYILPIVLYVLVIVCTYFFNSQKDMDMVKMFGTYAWVLLIYIYYSWYKCQGTLINGYVVFITAFFAFNLGQPLLHCFNIDAGFRDLLSGPRITLTLSEYIDASFMGLLFISVMHIGALCGILTTVSTNSGSIVKEDVDAKYKAIRGASLVFFLLSVPFWTFYNIKIMAFTIVNGYGGDLYDEIAEIPGYVRVLKDYFEPSLICLLFSTEYFGKNRYLVYLLTVLAIVIPPMVIGGRSQIAIFAAIFLVIYTLFHKMDWQKLILSGVVGICLLLMFFIIGRTRNSTGVTMDDYKSVVENSDTNPFVSLMAEMGCSMYPMGATIQLVPARDDYRLGSTYLWSFSTLIPNLGFWDRHPAQEYCNMGNWLVDKLNLTYGPGYSIAAEAYINFGFFGFIFFFFYGKLLSKYCRYINKENVQYNPFYIIATLIFLWFAIKTVRNSFVGTVRAVFYVALPMVWLFRFYYNRLRLKCKR